MGVCHATSSEGVPRFSPLHIAVFQEDLQGVLVLSMRRHEQISMTTRIQGSPHTASNVPADQEEDLVAIFPPRCTEPHRRAEQWANDGLEDEPRPRWTSSGVLLSDVLLLPRSCDCHLTSRWTFCQGSKDDIVHYAHTPWHGAIPTERCRSESQPRGLGCRCHRSFRRYRQRRR